MPAPRVSVIIVSYNSEDFIGKCISSVIKNLPSGGEVIVIDNFSSDSTVAELEQFGSNIKLIKSSENLGFSKACNKAAKEARGEYLFILNPDTEIDTPVLGELISFYESTQNAGIVGPRLIMADGEVQQSVKKLPTIWGAFKEYILGVKNAYSQYIPSGDEPTEVEMVYGAAMLIKRDLFQELGGFNEKFFLYYEDVDLCKRARAIGKKIYYYPQVSLKHLVGGTKSGNKYEKNLESSKRYHGIFKFLILQSIFRLHRFVP